SGGPVSQVMSSTCPLRPWTLRPRWPQSLGYRIRRSTGGALISIGVRQAPVRSNELTPPERDTSSAVRASNAPTRTIGMRRIRDETLLFRIDDQIHSLQGNDTHHAFISEDDRFTEVRTVAEMKLHPSQARDPDSSAISYRDRNLRNLLQIE